MKWLLRADVFLRMRQLAEGGNHSQDAIAAFTARAEDHRVSAAGKLPRIASIAGDVLEIGVQGVLTKSPDFWAWLLGGGNTTYTAIQESIAVAKADPSVARVVMRVDSPGGEVDGLFETLAAIEDLKESKPIQVIAETATSAAYAIAALAGPIHATSVGSMFGSVGVAMDIVQWEGQSVLSLTNSESPRKRPDLSTKAGRAVVVDQLDAIFDLFADAIARGRGVDADAVASDFGRGGVLLAQGALQAGMVDSMAGTGGVTVHGPTALAPAAAEALEAGAIAPTPEDVVAAALEATPPEAMEPNTVTLNVARGNAGEITITSGTGIPPSTGGHTFPATSAGFNIDAPPGGVANQKQEKDTMEPITLQDLRDNHPDVYAEAVQAGVNQERDRVRAHLRMGEACGDLSIAVTAIREGSNMSQELQAEYMSAGMNRGDRRDRQADSDETTEALEGASTVAEGTPRDMGDNVADLMAAARGKTEAVVS